MANENKDVLRVEAGFCGLPGLLRNKMIGFENDGLHRMLHKEADGAAYYWTPDGATGIDASDVSYSNAAYPSLSTVNLALDYAIGETGISDNVIPKKSSGAEVWEESLLSDDSSTVTVDGALQINTLAAAASDTDAFLVSDSGVIKARTGAEVLSDIGGAAAAHGVTTGTLPKAGSATSWADSIVTESGGVVTVGGGLRIGSNSISNNGTGGMSWDTNGYGTQRGRLYISDGTTPIVRLTNTAFTDANDARECRFEGMGYTAAEVLHTLAKQAAFHDGTGADQKGKWVWFCNDGEDGQAPTRVMELSSTALSLTGDLDVTGGLTTTAASAIGKDTGAGTDFTLRLRGQQVYNGTSNYGSYGSVLLDANTALTTNARKYLITNTYNGRNFAVVRSVDSTTDPAIGTNGAVSSGTVDFWIGNTGDATFAGDLAVTGNVTGANLNISNWDTAYGWGDHSTAGYLTAAPNHGVTANYVPKSGGTNAWADSLLRSETNLAAADLSYMENTGDVLVGWNRTVGGGEIDFIANRNNGTEGGFNFYDIDNSSTLTLIAEFRPAGVTIPGDLAVTGNVTGANLNISNWDTAYGWGDHSAAGYLTAAPNHGVTTGTIPKSGGTNAWADSLVTESGTTVTVGGALTTTGALTIGSINWSTGTFLVNDGGVVSQQTGISPSNIVDLTEDKLIVGTAGGGMESVATATHDGNTLTLEREDASITGTLDVLVLARSTTGTVDGSTMGTRLLFQLEDGYGNLDDMGWIKAESVVDVDTNLTEKIEIGAGLVSTSYTSYVATTKTVTGYECTLAIDTTDATRDSELSFRTGGTERAKLYYDYSETQLRLSANLQCDAGLKIASGQDLQLGNAYTVGEFSTTGYITVKDSSGTSYKIPVAAA